MSRRSSLVALPLSIALLAALSGCAVTGAVPTIGESRGPTAAPAVSSYLYAVVAATGEVSNTTTTDAGHESFVLTVDGLTGADAVVTRFTDRPQREASAVSLEDFVGQWPWIFGDDSPNAVVTYTSSESPMPSAIVVTLSDPVFDPDAGSLAFTAVRIISSIDQSPLAGWLRPALPSTLTSVSLLIDSSTMSTFSTGIDGVSLLISVATYGGMTEIAVDCGGGQATGAIAPDMPMWVDTMDCAGATLSMQFTLDGYSPSGAPMVAFEGRLTSSQGSVLQGWSTIISGS